jgi:hypothetical protein
MPSEWFTPGEPAERVVAMLAEGFCPFEKMTALDGTGLCRDCGGCWELVRSPGDRVTGFSVCWRDTRLPDERSTTISAYPFGWLAQARLDQEGARRAWDR